MCIVHIIDVYNIIFVSRVPVHDDEASSYFSKISEKSIGVIAISTQHVMKQEGSGSQKIMPELLNEAFSAKRHIIITLKTP